MKFELCGYNGHIFAIDPNREVAIQEVDILALIDSDYSYINPSEEDVDVGELDHDITYIGYFATISQKEERVRTITMFH